MQKNRLRHYWILYLLTLFVPAPHGLAADRGEAGASTTYTVTVMDTAWHDAPRNRTLPLRLRIPLGARDTPVILFSHGLGGSRDSGAPWGDYWTARGYLVVHIQHPGSDSTAVNTPDANSVHQYRVRILDVQFVIDELLRRWLTGDPLLERADLSRMGMSGHSFGAQTTMALAGMRLGDSIEGGVKPADARIRAALAFSPTSAGGETAESAYPYRFGAIQMPFMTITGTEDVEFSSRGYPWENRQIPYQHMPAPAKYLLVMKGADHWVYGGQVSALRPERPQDTSITGWVQSVSAAFWDTHLKGKPAPREWLDKLTSILGTEGSFVHK